MLPPRPRPADDPRNTRVWLRRELVADGLHDRAIARLVADGTLAKVRWGAYADGGTWAQLDEAGRYGLRGRAVLQQAKTEAVLSHASGLPEYDAPVWGIDLSNVHVTRTDGRTGRKQAGVQQHSGLILPGDVVLRNGVRVMSPTRIALEITTMAPTDASLCVVNYLLNAGLTDHAALHERYVGMQEWPDTLTTDLVLRLADDRIESVGETRTFHTCYQQGLPMPEPQYKVRDASGRVVARVDFAWPEHGVFLEFDGRIKYERLLRQGERASDVVIREKKREELVCRLTGWRCIRVTWADLANPERLAALIRAALAGAGQAA